MLGYANDFDQFTNIGGVDSRKHLHVGHRLLLGESRRFLRALHDEMQLAAALEKRDRMALQHGHARGVAQVIAAPGVARDCQKKIEEMVG